MKFETTDWGRIEWLHMPEHSTNQSITAMITEVAPHGKQPSHVHYGQEQFLYVMQGVGKHTVNGVERIYQAGEQFYMPADVTHASENIGEVPLREMIISSVSIQDQFVFTEEGFAVEDVDNGIIYSAVANMRSRVLETLHMPVVIFDSDMGIVWKGFNFPAYCQERCSIGDKSMETCACLLQQNDFMDVGDVEQWTCPKGITIYQVPISYKKQNIGTIRGGYIHLWDNNSISENKDIYFDEFYDMPKSSLLGIQKIMKQLRQSILGNCVVNEATVQIKEKDVQILHSEKQLYTIRDQVTNLKINHHFLFNTLNSMADMALMGSREDLYDAIICLAKLFRYTMVTNLRFVSIEAEVDYLGTYLELQKLRYGDGLEVQIQIEPEVNGIQVPFNFLQPIVENAFTHGFVDLDTKREVCIQGKRLEHKAQIYIYNNGSCLDENIQNRVRKSLSKNSGHGLSLIYEKLRSAYGEEFTMDIISNEEVGTCVVVEIPILT